LKFFCFVVCCLSGAANLLAQENWQQALQRMPLNVEIPLSRENCLPRLLAAFQSNQIVKAFVISPSVCDDFYLINRNVPKLTLKADNVFAAIVALTNLTSARFTCSPPLLLLHLERDALQPALIIKHPATAARLAQQSHFPHAFWSDIPWERVQPELRKALKLNIQPWAKSVDAWHIPRHNLTAWNLSDWDLVSALSLAGKTTILVQRNGLRFGTRETIR